LRAAEGFEDYKKCVRLSVNFENLEETRASDVGIRINAYIASVFVVASFEELGLYSHFIARAVCVFDGYPPAGFSEGHSI
jgi:hypothetical protein